MAKTLIIKGADFAANKLVTVGFDSIPCTGISVSPSTVSATSADPVTITATLTPANTTDQLAWATSDSSVVTVLNGMLSIVGNGTATVTATCGNQSAIVSVTVNVQPSTDTPQWEWASANVTNSVGTYTPSTSYKYITAFGKGTIATSHEVANTAQGDITYPYSIKLPSNATGIKVKATSASAFYDGTGSRVCWTKDEDSGTTGLEHKIKGIEKIEFNATEAPISLTAPSGADSFILTMRFTAAQSFESANACAENYGITIEFLTE